MIIKKPSAHILGEGLRMPPSGIMVAGISANLSSLYVTSSFPVETHKAESFFLLPLVSQEKYIITKPIREGKEEKKGLFTSTRMQI